MNRWGMMALVWLIGSAPALADDAAGKDRFTVDVVKGDLVYIPAAQVCAKMLDRYQKGAPLRDLPLFKDKGYTRCEVVESRESRGPQDCPHGRSIAGCDVCVIECE